LSSSIASSRSVCSDPNVHSWIDSVPRHADRFFDEIVRKSGSLIAWNTP
jgi:hypothetical protein